MTTKRFMSIALILGLFVLATAAFASNHGKGKGWNANNGDHRGPRIMQQLTPEQQQKFTNLQQSFLEDSANLRADMWAKQTELNALAGNSKVNPKTISNLVQELKEMRSSMAKKQTAFASKVEKEVGIVIGRGRGMGVGRGGRDGCPKRGMISQRGPANGMN